MFPSVVKSESKRCLENPGNIGDGGISGVDSGVFSGMGNKGSGDGVKGGSFNISLYYLVCLGCFGLEGGSKGPDKSDLLQKVLNHNH